MMLHICKSFTCNKAVLDMIANQKYIFKLSGLLQHSSIKQKEVCTYQLSETVEIVSGFIGPRKSIQKNWRICSNIFQRKYFENLFKATNFPDARGKFLLRFFLLRLVENHVLFRAGWQGSGLDLRKRKRQLQGQIIGEKLKGRVSVACKSCGEIAQFWDRRMICQSRAG